VTLSPRSIEVTWGPPVANVDDVDAYIISYDGVEGFAVDDSVSVGRLSTRAVINELEEFVSYVITVQAVYETTNVPSITVTAMTWSAGKCSNKAIRFGIKTEIFMELESKASRS